MKRFVVTHRNSLYLASVLFAVVALVGCVGAAAWITSATQLIPVAASMVVSILSLIAALSGTTMSTTEAQDVATAVSAIEGGLTSISSMVAEYQANPSTTLLGQIVSGTKAVIDNINSFLTSIHVVDPATQAKITAMLTLVLNEVESFASLLPILSAGPGDKVAIVVPMSTKQAKEAFNAILSAPSGNPAVDAALAKLKRL